jgi:hypothetical protein
MVWLAATKHPLKDLSVPGGIGATRASFDLLYGAPVSDTFGDIEKQFHSDNAHYLYVKNGITMDVLFVVNKDNKERAGDRAYDFIMVSAPGKAWSLVDAGIIAGLLLPKDAKATSDLAPVPGVATAEFDWEEQTFTSAFVAKVIPGKTWYLNDQVGLITVSLQPDAPGVYTQINVGTDVN